MRALVAIVGRPLLPCCLLFESSFAPRVSESSIWEGRGLEILSKRLPQIDKKTMHLFRERLNENDIPNGSQQRLKKIPNLSRQWDNQLYTTIINNLSKTVTKYFLH